MLTFNRINIRSAGKLRRYYKDCTYQLCEYSVGVKLMWKQHFNPVFAEHEGCLIVKNLIHGTVYFDYPVALPGADLTAALDEIDAYCLENGILPKFVNVPEAEMPRLTARYPYLTTTCNRLWQDYLYHSQDLIQFAGRKYSGQRNHINKFKKLYPEARFRPITPEDREELEAFWDVFHQTFNKENAMAKKELCYARKLTHQIGKSWCLAGAIEWEGRFIAIALGEICGDTLICHIEKGLPQYEGVYPFMVQSFAACFGQECTYLNREDDAADRGLRTSKTQYLPCAMGKKYQVEVACELRALEDIPSLLSDRLTLDAIQRTDIPDYNRLCLDEERNRWWGYDYRKDLKGPLSTAWFYRVAAQDFKNRLAINFAIRLDKQFIGECVLYHFDGRGNAELGCRILPEFSGQGYGAEAFARVADWSLYELGLVCLKAKCYRENQASYRMLSAAMRPDGEDETFFYFTKTI